jgi:Fur family ferric uptake transcriptional regulator
MTELTGLAEKLKRAGHKLTAPRRAVVEVLEQDGEHLSPNEVLARGRQIYPRLSRATVYRTLDLLTGLGLIRPIYLHDTSQRYVTAQGGHHHLVCIDCGVAFEFEQCEADQLTVTLSERFQFEIHSHLLEFYGLCETCKQDQEINHNVS